MPRGVYKRKPKPDQAAIVVDLLVALDKLLPMEQRKLLRTELEKEALLRRIRELEDN